MAGGNPIVANSTRIPFGGFQRTEDLASRLEFESNRWLLDMHHNYHDNPGFAAVYRDAYGVLAAARRMHSEEHLQNHGAIVQEVTAVDLLFHGVQEQIQGWRSENNRPVPVGSLIDKTIVVESILHHLAFDSGVKPHSEGPVEEQAPVPGGDGAPAPGPVP